MIPSGIRLYSWIDVEDVLLRTQEEGGWPGWLLSARAYWDGLTLGVEPGQEESARRWLTERFEPRFRNGGSLAIELESASAKERLLSVLIEIEDIADLPAQPRFTPTLARPSVLRKPAGEPVHPEPLPDDLPPVVAFHSFKGGVGRTLHALALALSLTRRKDMKVLLVDGDLEAPGLTWLFQERFPQLPVSLLDLLALVHGDPDPKSEDSIALVADRTREIHLDGIFGLPAFRTLDQLGSIEVRPEHLIQGAHDPFVLTSVLARLGGRLGAQVVIVDLRAGFSEMSAGLLLDPRVHRILVSTLSSQSLEGTRQTLELLGERSPSRREEEPLPALILSQVPARDEKALQQAESMLIEAARAFLPERTDETTAALLDILPVTTPFDPRFVVLPGSWGEVLRLLEQSELPQRLALLAERLPLFTTAPLTPAKEEPSGELSRHRDALQNYAHKLIFAETSDIRDFLPIVPLRNLASDFANRPPVAVVVGSKGAGKTYTFLQAVHRGTWSRFVRDIGELSPAYEASLCPVLQSSNLAESARLQAEQALQASVHSLNLPSPFTEAQVRHYIRDGLRQELHEGEWRERWLNAIAWRLGFDEGQEDAGARLPDYLRQTGKSAVAIMDGLEDLFQSLFTSPREQTALRALLQDVPTWIEQQPLRPLGIVVFVRRDMVLSAIKQNPAQLIARYEQYGLKWGADEALRLVLWTAAKANALPGIDFEAIESMDRSRLAEALIPLWGRKLGSERSREARSVDWVIAVLSDLKGQIQARDLVRFLHEAAKGSMGDGFWKDRVLVPAAMRSAVGHCSRAKIEEIGQENPEVMAIFNKLRNLPEEARQVPFVRDRVQLTIEEMKTLEDNGAVVREGDLYYMPEIFRLGLGFTLERGARPRVLTLARGRR
jgi:cellulose biosynthesis protein BcsQ